ncbi:hypothetical protein ILUMI_03075 [Ignelater luminosus]|uniref:Endonuclease/exonuclease/phosphatase domain-containing protein n=1 Tax=Ignelater luminosus TaxID=2038154 RepID=A0A8K0DC91_IGNLU|nr:hypothetical protein ILUMI_03075 [Ignelater luminosus]
MNIGTWNVKGLSTKQNELLNEIKRFDMDIAAVTEIKKQCKGMVVIGIYAPCNDELHTVKDDHDDNLNQLLNTIGSRKEITILGDFNAHVGSKANDPVVGPYGENYLNDNGSRLIEICYQHSLQIKN